MPKKLRTDAAKDFTSTKFQTFVKGKNIVHFVTHNENKQIMLRDLLKL